MTVFETTSVSKLLGKIITWEFIEQGQNSRKTKGRIGHYEQMCRIKSCFLELILGQEYFCHVFMNLIHAEKLITEQQQLQ